MLTHRLATAADLEALSAIMALAICHNQAAFLDADQIEASSAVMGLDTQLVADGTYYVVEVEGRAVGCGGWSYRATTYGGDHSEGLRDAALVDPEHDPARIRAMYTHPDFTRRGIGRRILTLCEGAAREAGFASVVLMATLSGEPLYRAAGFDEVERHIDTVNGIEVPLILMRKSLA
ncbi:MAG: GNAT family N-acetyltransferase [Sphingomicrobium sp.]